MRQACTVTSSAAGGVNTRFDHDPIVRCTRLMATRYMCARNFMAWYLSLLREVHSFLFCFNTHKTKI